MKKTCLFLVSLASLFAAGCAAAAAGDGPGDEPAEASEKADAPPEHVGTAQSADGFPTASMTVRISTGGDDLRSSSVAYFRVLRADGTWSSEVPIFVGGLSAWSTATATINSSTWDGYDACARAFQLRLQQGSCFGCTSDNWDVQGMTVDFSSVSTLGGWRTLFSQSLGARLTESAPTLQVSASAIPPGTYCRNNTLIADCSGNPVDTATAMAWEQDSYCDDGGYGMYLKCGAFEYDNGACGIPSAWSCSTSYYHAGAADGCDCNCGAWDPDCNDPAVNSRTRTVYGCPAGNTCANGFVSPGVYAPKCVAPVM